MKKILVLMLMLNSNLLFAQQEFEGIQVQTLDGVEIPLTEIVKNEKDKPVILFTWSKKSCSPCIRTLDFFNSLFYKELNDKYGLKFIALNIDDEKNIVELKKYTADKKWSFNSYQDPSRNYLTKLEISNTPYIYLIINNKIEFLQIGFATNMITNSTAIFMNEMITFLDTQNVFLDEFFRFTTKEKAHYTFSTKLVNGVYKYESRYLTGELYQTGTSLDRFGKKKIGIFTRYYKNGKKKSE
jgi:thiol-disulfide isomerase/thioredoxin